jgi:phospholipid-binding lipoprotein MlaA
MQAIDPRDLRTGLYVTRLIDTRAGLLDAGNLMQEAALDRYIFLRDAYLQRRRSLVYDGRPPRDPER